MRLTTAEKKFLCLSIAAITLVQAGRTSLLHAGPARGSANPPVVETSERIEIKPEWEATDELVGDVVTEADLEAADATSQAASVSLLAATTCFPLGVGGSLPYSPLYFTYYCHLSILCNPGDVVTNCSDIMFVCVLYKQTGPSSWVNLSTWQSVSSDLSIACGVQADVSFLFPMQRANVASTYGNGTYRFAAFAYPRAAFQAGLYGLYISQASTDWTTP